MGGVVDLTHETRFVTLLHRPTGRPFFSAPMTDAASCCVCSARSTFLFNDRTSDRMCNTCCGELKGIVVMDSKHGYGAFAVACQGDSSFPEPHIDPPLPLSVSSTGPLVFRPGDVVCEMGGTLLGVADLDAAYGALGTPYAAACAPLTALDSTLVRNAAAYINSVGAGPNVRMYATDRGVVVVALADIRHGEELLVDYGPDFPWDVECLVTEEPGPFTTEVARDRHGALRAVHLIL
jgi:hypothetical protein